MAGDTTKFVVEFQAEIKKLKQAFSELRKDQDRVKQDNKKTRQQDQQHERSKDRIKKQVRKEDDKQRKAELSHIKLMKREEMARHKASLNLIQKSHNENLRLMKKTADLEKKLTRGRGGGGGGAAGQPNQRGGFWKGLGVGAGAMMVGQGLWNLLVGGASSGYQLYNEYGAAMGRNAGLGRGKDIRRAVRGARGSRLGYSLIDTASMVPMTARSTGQLGPRELQQGARSTGMEAPEVAEIFGMIRRSGYDFQPGAKGTNSKGANEFKKIIAAGMASGLEKGRLPEFTQGLMQLVEQQRQQYTGQIDVGALAKTLATWGSSGRPGLQGTAGASVYGKVAGAISGGGGNEWAQGLFLRAMGFGKPGGNTSYYQAERSRESAGRDPSVVMKVMQQMASEFRGFKNKDDREEAGFAMRDAFGITLEQAEQLQDIYTSVEDLNTKQGRVQQLMDQAKPIDQQSLEAMKGIGGQLSRIAEKTDKGVAIGARVAPVIETIEDVQYKILEKLVSIAEGIAELVKDVKAFTHNGGAANAASNQVDEAAAARERAHRAKTPAGVLSGLQESFTSAAEARKKALAAVADPSAMEDVASFAKGDFGRIVATKQRMQAAADAAKEQQRAAGEFAVAQKLKAAGKDITSPASQKAIRLGGRRAVALGVDDPGTLYNMLDNPSGLEKTRKKTDGGTVDAKPAPLSPNNDGGKTESGAGKTLQGKVTVNVSSGDARNMPSIAPQNPGGLPIVPTRGVQ